MIAYLRGTLASKAQNSIVIDIHGVGYGLTISLHTFYSLPEISQEVRLYTYPYVREETIQLYGFHSMEEKRIFLHLITISGIGPKLALTILSGIAPHEFTQAIDEHNVTRLQKIPGVGRKTAERIVLEMKHKLKLTAPEAEPVGLPPGGEESPYSVALTALMNLGYRQQEATQALTTAQKKVGTGASVEELLRESLRAMAS